MIRLFAVSLISLAVLPTLGFAEEPFPPGHSTVHIAFIVPQTQQTTQFGFGADSSPMARVGDIILPAASIQPIAITIDGEFVGHALAGQWYFEPVFVLPEGVRKFSFTYGGSEPVTAKLKVLGTGSKQYLIVKLPVIEDAANVVDDPTARGDESRKDRSSSTSADLQ